MTAFSDHCVNLPLFTKYRAFVNVEFYKGRLITLIRGLISFTCTIFLDYYVIGLLEYFGALVWRVSFCAIQALHN